MQGLQALDQFKSFVSKIGGLGRYEDTYMVHAAEGETVIPMEVLDQNPILKKRLFKTMMDMGIEPGRYIVGNELNSKNPVTGQPEFFLKKIVDRLKKAAADVSGYAAPIAGAMYGPGVGAMVGAGLGAFKRENPGDPNQALQMALRGGASGVAANLAGGADNIFTGRGAADIYNSEGFNVAELGKRMLGMDKKYATDKQGLSRFFKSDKDTYRNTTLNKLFGKPSPEELSILEKRATTLVETGINPDGSTAKLSEISTAQDILDKKSKGKLNDLSFKELASIYGGGTLLGGFLFDMTTDKNQNIGQVRDPYEPTGEVYSSYLNPTMTYADPVFANKGGVMDLQQGGESKGPGTGTSDSIPAMLSDGEFVMTADAVRGAGGGDRREGAKKMYEAIDQLEARA